MGKVDLYAAIRRDARAGMSGRAIEAKYPVSRRTVGKALASAWPQPGKPLPPKASKLDRFKPLIDAILRADLDAPRKQRHTAKRIFDRLVGEQGMTDVSYPVVRRYVRERAGQIRVEAGRAPVEAFVPQSHRPGVEAEVDFGEVVVNLRGQQVTCMLFALRMSYSGKGVHRIFASGGQEAFLEGHVHAFTVLGGVSTGKVRYDNLRSAMAQVLGFSRQRVETARWTAFRSHYDLDAFYCQSGRRGAPGRVHLDDPPLQHRLTLLPICASRLGQMSMRRNACRFVVRASECHQIAGSGAPRHRPRVVDV